MGDAATPVLPNKTTQFGQTYPANIDAGFAVLDRVAWAFAPHEETVPVMTVRLEAGALFDGTSLIEVAAQSTSTIVAPATARIDRVVIDAITGVVSIITGVDQASPPVPTLTSGVFPICQVNLVPAQATILNSDITDERVPVPGPVHANAANIVHAHEFFI